MRVLIKENNDLKVVLIKSAVAKFDNDNKPCVVLKDLNGYKINIELYDIEFANYVVNCIYKNTYYDFTTLN